MDNALTNPDEHMLYIESSFTSSDVTGSCKCGGWKSDPFPKGREVHEAYGLHLAETEKRELPRPPS